MNRQIDRYIDTYLKKKKRKIQRRNLLLYNPLQLPALGDHREHGHDFPSDPLFAFLQSDAQLLEDSFSKEMKKLGLYNVFRGVKVSSGM